MAVFAHSSPEASRKRAFQALSITLMEPACRSEMRQGGPWGRAGVQKESYEGTLLRSTWEFGQ